MTATTLADALLKWDHRALEFLAAHWRARRPERVWSSFEFVSIDGDANEIDALVLTGNGPFPVDIPALNSVSPSIGQPSVEARSVGSDDLWNEEVVEVNGQPQFDHLDVPT